MKTSKLISFFALSVISYFMLNTSALAQEVRVDDNTGHLNGGSRVVQVSNGEFTLVFCYLSKGTIKTFKVSTDGTISPLDYVYASDCYCLTKRNTRRTIMFSQPGPNRLYVHC
jgi:hypothetical protein